jgi:uncharacterized membrane protein
VRATSETAACRRPWRLAEVALCLALFAACVHYIRLR